MQRRFFPSLALASATAALLAAGCSHQEANNNSSPTPSGSGGGKTYTITMIPKSAAADYWKAVHAGADDAAKKDNVTVNWQAPTSEQDSARQTTLVENSVTSKSDALALAPINAGALVGAVQTANKANIPVSIFDSGIGPGADYVSFVATDNMKGGQMAAQQMGKALGGKGKVIMVPVTAGAASTTARENGFKDVMAKQFPGIQIVTTTYCNADRSKARSIAEDALTANPDVKGLYGPNEDSIVGELGAVQDRNLAGKVVLVGFDATQPLIDSVKSGTISALVTQNPYKMGYEAVDVLVQKLKGGNPPKNVDTGASLITKETLATPDVQNLLKTQNINP